MVAQQGMMGWVVGREREAKKRREQRKQSRAKHQRGFPSTATNPAPILSQAPTNGMASFFQRQALPLFAVAREPNYIHKFQFACRRQASLSPIPFLQYSYLFPVSFVPRFLFFRFAIRIVAAYDVTQTKPKTLHIYISQLEICMPTHSFELQIQQCISTKYAFVNRIKRRGSGSTPKHSK